MQKGLFESNLEGMGQILQPRGKIGSSYLMVQGLKFTGMIVWVDHDDHIKKLTFSKEIGLFRFLIPFNGGFGLCQGHSIL